MLTRSLTTISHLLLACLLCPCTNLLLAQRPSQLRDLNSHCPFTPPVDLSDWEHRSEQVRRQLRVSLGLLPAPDLPPVEADIYGRIEFDGYSIEKVTFESLAGLYVTGNLYRPNPLPQDARLPGILCPHGHWTEARFYEASSEEVKQLLATGAERFENAARNHIQARCVQLARMGCVVFHWDMLGYCDSNQISFDRAHRFSQQPAASEVTDEGWLLFSPRAESELQSVLGLQSLATQRAVDMLLELPEIDPQRIAITGASGGGTQSFIGAALDPRIQVAFPAVMVSTGMQGGCTCENASLLRTGTGNVEIAALIAPRPLGLTAANDWTRTMPQDGFPELQALYDLYGQPKNVQLFPALHFGHNFNHVSRVAMYGWMNDHLNLGLEKPVLERDFDLATKPELTCWDSEHPQPAGGESFERKLLEQWSQAIDKKLTQWLHGDQAEVQQLLTVLQEGWSVCLGLTAFPLQANPETTQVTKQNEKIQFSTPRDGEWSIAIESRASGAHDTPGMGKVHLHVTGDRTATYVFQYDNREQSLVDNPRRAAAYTYGYNLPKFARQSRQLAHLLNWLASQYPGQQIKLSASGAAAACAAAAVFCHQHSSGEVLSTQPKIALNLQPNGFRFASVDSIRSAEFLPGSVRYWDLPGLLASLSAVKLSIDIANKPAYRRLQPLFDRQQLEIAGQ